MASNIAILIQADIVDRNAAISPAAAKGHTVEIVEKMHKAWRNSMQLQVALSAKPYTDPALALGERR